jgi:hypothetical protein
MTLPSYMLNGEDKFNMVHSLHQYLQLFSTEKKIFNIFSHLSAHEVCLPLR